MYSFAIFIEINNTFYRLPQAQTFDVWRAQAPQDFCYALKFSRYGSHLKHLKEPHASIEQCTTRLTSDFSAPPAGRML